MTALVQWSELVHCTGHFLAICLQTWESLKDDKKSKSELY